MLQKKFPHTFQVDVTVSQHELWNFRSHVLSLPGTKVP